MPSKRPSAKKGAKTSAQYRAPALDRGLDILALLTERTEPVGASDIARSLGRTKTQIYRMLQVLEHRGYIARDDSDRYKLTELLFDLGMRQAAKRALHEAALPVMGRLAETTLQSCHIGIVSGEDIVVIARVESPGPISFAVRLGYRVPLLESTSGRVVFAFQTPERQTQWLRQLSCGKGRAAALKGLEADAAKIVRQGYAFEPSRLTPGVHDIGAPIRAPSGEAIASLTVPYLAHRYYGAPITEVKRLVVAAAKEISAALR